MRKALVLRNGIEIGVLVEASRNEYIFTYHDNYFANKELPPVSITMPKNQQSYSASTLFPFFENILSEGVNRKLQSQQLRIDENDSFGLLLATAQFDTVGAITIQPT